MSCDYPIARCSEPPDPGCSRIKTRAGVPVRSSKRSILFVVYTWRGISRRIISARLASRRERNAYRQTLIKSNRLKAGWIGNIFEQLANVRSRDKSLPIRTLKR
ncbi:MAG: BrnT family toxin [Deltaproteobacteria bacterium]|nr:BrnT family toxin [Deltaproteobacteria bacterium]